MVKGRGGHPGGTGGMGVTAAPTAGDQNELVNSDEWHTRKRPSLTSSLVLQNLEMHDRMEHLIEKQISHGNFSTQNRAKTENPGR